MKFQVLSLTALVLVLNTICVADDSVKRYAILGQGIYNETTHETLFLSCVGEKIQETNGINCNRLQFVRWEEGFEPTTLGQIFPAKNLYTVAEELKSIYHATFSNRFLSLYTGKSIGYLTQKSGWNWSERPVPMNDEQFKKVVMTSLYYSNFKKTKESQTAIDFNTKFQIGDAVIVNNDFSKILRVKEKLKGALYHLSDGSKLPGSTLSLLVDQKEQFKVGSYVINISSNPDFRKSVGNYFGLYSIICAISERGAILVGSNILWRNDDRPCNLETHLISDHVLFPAPSPEEFKKNSNYMVFHTDRWIEAIINPFEFNDYYVGFSFSRVPKDGDYLMFHKKTDLIAKGPPPNTIDSSKLAWLAKVFNCIDKPIFYGSVVSADPQKRSVKPLLFTCSQSDEHLNVFDVDPSSVL